MSLGNIWLGTLQLVPVNIAQSLTANSANLETPVLSAASVMDRVLFHVQGACTEIVTFSLVPAAGTQYSTVVIQTSTSGKTDLFFQPDRPLFLYPGDQFKIRCTNTGLTATVYGNVLVLA